MGITVTGSSVTDVYGKTFPDWKNTTSLDHRLVPSRAQRSCCRHAGATLQRVVSKVKLHLTCGLALQAKGYHVFSLHGLLQRPGPHYKPAGQGSLGQLCTLLLPDQTQQLQSQQAPSRVQPTGVITH